jgi:hypothetical protein
MEGEAMTKHPQDRHSRRLVVPLTPKQDDRAYAYARRVGIPLAAIARNALLEIVNAPPTDRRPDDGSVRGVVDAQKSAE